MFPAPHHSVPGYVKPLLDLVLASEGPPAPLLSASNSARAPPRPCSGGLPRLGLAAARTASSLSSVRSHSRSWRAQDRAQAQARAVNLSSRHRNPIGGRRRQMMSNRQRQHSTRRGGDWGGGKYPFSAMDVLETPNERPKAWYLALMAPNTKGAAFAWLDPSRLYCNSQALADCVEDMLGPFRHDAIDLVAGIDAMGFILGASIASTLGKGFLAVRKAGHLCVSAQQQTYGDYTGREKTMEVRDDVLKPGVRVLLVDQWIETGGTMMAAIQLLERMGATIVGVAAVAMENTERGKWIKDNYKCSHCIPEELQSQIDQKHLDSFKSFTK
ncbi:uncharacterized protein zgc:174895 isoform X2 [Phyllopteryx taeniolatus]|uniref:uncharacterized protein zgc:174895 isoform X2 n=1 Tax=Phyllopteryx taeniolatus TaxID=161469 RepID=UPI002AD3B025|nr:uncharacterized protein zgc:174895 isoform X2 [Phyllopteryx taeniolatus]